MSASPSRPPSLDQLINLERLRQEEARVLREAALQSTWVMVTEVLWPDVAAKHYWEPTHKPIWDWLDASPEGAKRAVVCTREFRKTMYNIARCVRLICKDPNIRIMVMSAYQRTATDMCGLVKRQFLTNPNFRKVFPEFAIDDIKFGKQDEFTHPARTLQSYLDPTFFATYLGAPLISRRADIIILDDPVDEDMVANPDVAQNTMDKFTQIIPLVDKTSAYRQVFFIGTPKSYNDPISAIRGTMGDSEKLKTDKEVIGGWEVVIRPISYVPNGDFFTGGDFAFPDENPAAKAALPNVHSPEMIREIYQECCRNPNKGEGYFFKEFGCLVQAPGDQKFHKEWFDTWIDPAQVPINTVFSGIAVDSALKDEQILFRGDNTVILIGHVDQWGRVYLTDGARSKAWKSDDFRKVLLSMVDHPKNRGAQNFLREKIGEGMLFPMVRGWFNEARKPIVMHPLKVIGQGKKYLRITEALQGPAMGRKIFFVKSQFPEDLHRILVDELVHLGQWGHDDIADALSLFYHPEVRVVPESKSRVQWKDPVSRSTQVSTAWTNPGALAAAQQAGAKPKVNERLSPFGEMTILSGDAWEGGRGPTTMPEEGFEWVKIQR